VLIGRESALGAGRSCPRRTSARSPTPRALPCASGCRI